MSREVIDIDGGIYNETDDDRQVIVEAAVFHETTTVEVGGSAVPVLMTYYRQLRT